MLHAMRIADRGYGDVSIPQSQGAVYLYIYFMALFRSTPPCIIRLYRSPYHIPGSTASAALVHPDRYAPCIPGPIHV